MKTKNLLLCLLFLVLGTTAAFADKYYMPGTYRASVTPRKTIAELANTGVKFMIYNTAINGGEDRTGFLRCSGTNFQHDKTKERDLLVYNESFVYTMDGFDTDSDGDFDYYAIKSVQTGTYVNYKGEFVGTDPAAAKLSITAWDDAAGKSGANMEDWQYSVIENGKIKETGNGTTVFVVKAYETPAGESNPYWNGNVGTFATWSDAHPFAFYVVDEVTTGDYLQDLHIYSRCDIYSAQVIYGYVQAATAMSAFPEAQNLDNMIDGDLASAATTGTGSGNHYFQFYLGKEASSIYLYLQRNATAANVPATIQLQGGDGTAFTNIGDPIPTNLGTNLSYTSDAIDLGAPYTHIRIVNTTADAQMSFSEISILPVDNKVDDAIDYFEEVNSSSVYTHASAKQYAELVADYNNIIPETRLLSGVPLPGNKYRIYADAYDMASGEYISQEIYANGTDLSRAEGGTYSGLPDDDQAKYEWYCEKTNDGFLVFRNVADPAKYLGYGAVSDTPYKWSINTVLTQRFGVPLKNQAQQYLAVANSGDFWQGDVKDAVDQTKAYSYTYVDDKGDDDASNDETKTAEIATGICTDFVFIPVPVDANEKKITFTANDLVQRNAVFSYDNDGDGVAETISLPFSRMFVQNDGVAPTLPTVTISFPDKHPFDGCYIDGAKDNSVLNDESANPLTFNFDEISDGDVIDVRFTIAEPFKYYGTGTGEEIALYLLQNRRGQSVPQQARPQRADADIDMGGDEDRVSTASGTYYYAKFDTRSTNMTLVSGAETVTDFTGFDATSLFYFRPTDELQKDNCYAAFIHNATTTTMCAASNSWTNVGEAYYIQPNSKGVNLGYTIARTPLNATNNPNDAWCTNHDTDPGKILDYDANDAGSSWEFVRVSNDNAAKLLKDYISAKSTERKGQIETLKEQNATDDTKADDYIDYITDLNNASQLLGTADADIQTLVVNAQKIHMLEHEIKYALQSLPLPSKESEIGSANKYEAPHWYYLKNVKSESVDSEGRYHYAKYTGESTPMALDPCDDGKKLAHMFYFKGDKSDVAIDDNNLTIDEYLKVKIHNFLSGNKSVLSKNDELYTYDPSQDITKGEAAEITSGINLKSTESWSLSMEYKLDGTSLNAYGSCLLASTNSQGTLGNNFYGGFQVYFKDDRSIVVKVNNGDDRYRFWHTQDAFSTIKVVLTYALGNVTIDVYNADNIKETQVVTKVTMNDITTLSAALPKSGVTLKSLSAERVDAMKWAVGDGTNDIWYIMPSSNETFVGNAIVMTSAHDSNMGWTNVNGANGEIFTDLGSADNSTWQYERVTNFDSHLDELLDAYGMDNVVIYNKELVDFYNIIEKGKATIYDEAYNGTAAEEAAFNEIYTAFNSYTGPEAAELKAPKPGKFYTIHHVPASMPNDFMVSDRNVVKVGEDTDTADGCISRGVWYFEGTESDGFLALDGDLKLKSLHTLSYPYADGFTADSLKLSDEESAAVEIEKVRAAQVRLKVNSNYLATGADAKSNYIVTNADALATPNYVGTTFSHEGGANVQASSVKYDNVAVSTTLAATQDGSNIDAFKTGGSITSSILCPAQRASDTESPEFIFTLTYTGLPAGFAFNNVGLDIHALNGSGNYQYNTEGATVPRQWNVAIAVAEDEGEYTEFGGFTDTDIAAGVGTSGNVHKVWNFAKDGGYTKAGDGKLKVKITVTKGTTNKGCFFGLSSVELSNSDARHDQWYIEEVENPESIYHSMSTASAGHATLMLGFPALIPGEVEAFRGVKHGPMGNVQYFSMVSYGEPGETRILPANTPVVVRNTDASATEKDVKFFYRESDAERVEDNYIRGSLYYKVVNAQAHDNTNPITSALDGQDVNIYMLQTNKGTSKFYWIYEEASSDGTIAPGNANTDNGGYVVCNANKAYLILPAATTSVTSYSLRFSNGETTDIEEVFDGANENEVEQVETIYDLSGRKLTEITAPGVYIVNGKKVLVK